MAKWSSDLAKKSFPVAKGAVLTGKDAISVLKENTQEVVAAHRFAMIVPSKIDRDQTIA